MASMSADNSEIRYFPFAKVSGCTDGNVEDTGTVLYVLTDHDCPNSGNIAVTLGVFFGRSLAAARSETIETTFPDFGSPHSVTIPRLGQREVTVFRKGQWLRRDNGNTWAPRDGAGLLVKDGKIFLLGGWLHGPGSNEVWVSENLRDWQFLGFAPWPQRHGAGWVVHRNRLYVIGGDLFADVWSSEDGISWQLEAADAPFGPRYAPNAASLGDKLVVYAGQHWEPSIDVCVESPECGVVGNRDVWESEDGGQTWQLATPAAPWEGRGLIHGSIVFNDEIYLIGGGLKAVLPGTSFAETVAEYSDIWSSPDGRQWRQRSAQFSFPPRTHFSVLGTPHGCFVSDGSVGTQANVVNDLFFARDCINFTPVPNPPLQPRHASSVAYFNGTVIILGGPPVGDALTDVWQYVPES